MGEDLFLIVQLICLSTMLSFAGAGTNSAMVVGHNGVMLMPVAPEANQVGRTSINFLLQRGFNHGEIGMFFFLLGATCLLLDFFTCELSQAVNFLNVTSKKWFLLFFICGGAKHLLNSWITTYRQS